MINNLVQVEILELGNSVMVECRLLTAFTERAHCEVWYGTDPSHHVLSYHDVSDNAGTGGDVLTIPLSHNLQHNTTYYYNISIAAANGNLCTKVLHSFRIGNEQGLCIRTVDSFNMYIRSPFTSIFLCT